MQRHEVLEFVTDNFSVFITEIQITANFWASIPNQRLEGSIMAPTVTIIFIEVKDLCLFSDSVCLIVYVLYINAMALRVEFCRFYLYQLKKMILQDLEECVKYYLFNV